MNDSIEKSGPAGYQTARIGGSAGDADPPIRAGGEVPRRLAERAKRWNISS